MALRTSALVASLVAFISCGKDQPPASPSPTTPTILTAPLARISVTIDDLGSAVAVQSLSEVRFDASQSGGSRPVLTYFLDYGDGESTTQPVSLHTYQAPGTYVAKLKVVDNSGLTNTISQSVEVRSFEGAWFAASWNQRASRVEIRRLSIGAQKGRTITGEFFLWPDRVQVAVSGSLGTERSVRLALPGQQDVTGTIPSTVTGDAAVLTLNGFGGSEPIAFQPIVGTPASAPPVARLRLHLDDDGSTGAVKDFTPIGFSAADSQADDPRFFFLEFGDGDVTTAATAVHACRQSYLLTSRSTVVDGFGRFDSVTQEYTCRNFVYIYEFLARTATYSGAHFLVFKSQSGAVFRGEYSFFDSTERRPPSRSTFTATLSGQNDIRIVLDDGSMILVGRVLIQDAWSPHSNFPNARVVVTAQGGWANGSKLDFGEYDPW